MVASNYLINDHRDFDLGNLCIAASRARLVQARQRKAIVDMTRDFAGPYWGSEAAFEHDSQPVNLLQLYVTITVRNLIQKCPRAMVETFNQEAKWVAKGMGDWFNKKADAMRLDDTFKRAIINAMFCMGITKVGIAAPGDAASHGWGIKAGDPFAKNIDFDDYVYDIHARDDGQFDFEGHRFRIPRQAAIAQYGAVCKELAASEDRIFNMEGDERLSYLGRGTLGDITEYEDKLDLWEFWLPRHGVIVTLADDYMGTPSEVDDGVASKKFGSHSARALRVQKWIGPWWGPYIKLGFITVPGSSLPKGPLQDLWDLHKAINHILRKLIRQAQRQKELLIIGGQADADGKRTVDANDGDAIRADHPEGTKVATYGGPNQMNNQLYVDLTNRFSWMAENLEVRGGLSPQGRTATQEKILNQNSSGAVADMLGTANQYMERVNESLMWFFHHHPSKVMKTHHQEKGLPDIGFTRTITPQDRQQIPWEQLGIRIHPYSQLDTDPMSRANDLQGIVQQIISPFATVMAQQGKMLNFDMLMQKLAEYHDDPDFLEIVTNAPPPQEPPQGGAGDKPGVPTPQETTHVRQNMPGRTQQGTDQMMKMAGAGINPGGAVK